MSIYSIQKQKMAFTGHVLRGSSGEDALQILEGKLEATRPTAQRRPRRMWLDDIKQWTQLNYAHALRSRGVREHNQYSHSLPFPLVNSHFHSHSHSHEFSLFFYVERLSSGASHNKALYK